jgi:hypothetical protein
MNRSFALALSLLTQCSSDPHQTMLSSIKVSEFGPAIAPNPWAAGHFATQHGDTGASDTSPLPGPGIAPVVADQLPLAAACPTILPLSSGLAVAVCTKLANQTPSVFLFDPRTLRMVATRELSKGELFGGVYPYLDEQERLIAVDGANQLLRIQTDASLSAELTQLPLEHDAVVGLAPDYAGRDWFATTHGIVGTVSRAGAIATLALPEGELVANSIATAPSGVALVSDHALYLMNADDAGVPRVTARVGYDRGPARKPGQLSWGSGSTPTFFGPHTGSDYVAITDNARPLHLVVVHDDGTPVCTVTVPSPAGDGSEDSPIGAGRSVFVASSYGFVYPALPSDAGPSDPTSAPFVGGMARIDVADDERSCAVVWTNTVASAAGPKLSLLDGLIYTVAQHDSALAFSTIDAVSGTVLAEQQLANIATPMQLAGTLAPGRSILQGTLTGIVRISPAD